MKKTKKMMTTTHMLKRCVSLLFALIISLTLVLPGFAENEEAVAGEGESLVTMLAVPSFEYEDEDIIKISVFCNSTGKIQQYKLFAYNNFCSKVAMPDGEYTFITACVVDDYSNALEADVSDFIVRGNTDLVFNLHRASDVAETAILPEETSTANVQEYEYEWSEDQTEKFEGERASSITQDQGSASGEDDKEEMSLLSKMGFGFFLFVLSLIAIGYVIYKKKTEE